MRFSQLSFLNFCYSHPRPRVPRGTASMGWRAVAHLGSAGCLLFLSLFFAISASAQTDSAITGDIRDTNGAVLVGVQVTAKNLDTGLTRTTTSQDEGRFVFPGVPVGVYELRGSFAGFEPLVFPDVRLTVNETTEVSLVMKVSTLNAAVTVSSGEALVNTQTPELSYLVGERAIRDLPLNGRNYTDLAFLQPGVIPYVHPDGGSVVAHGLGISINGQDPRSNVYLLDGTSRLVGNSQKQYQGDRYREAVRSQSPGLLQPWVSKSDQLSTRNGLRQRTQPRCG